MTRKWWVWLILVVGCFMLVGGGLAVARPVKEQVVTWKDEVTNQIVTWKDQYETKQRMTRPRTALVTRVIDGDTIEIAGGERVRYIGIDAPESLLDTERSRLMASVKLEDVNKGCLSIYAEAAEAFNYALVYNREVRLLGDLQDKDHYGRLLRYVYVGNTFVNSELVEQGWAQVLTIPPNTKYADHFAQLAESAIANKAGIYVQVGTYESGDWAWAAFSRWEMNRLPPPPRTTPTPTPRPSPTGRIRSGLVPK